MPVAGFCQTGCANGCYQTNALAFAFGQIISSGVLLSLCSYELHRLSFPLFPGRLIHPQNSLHLLGVKSVSKIFQFIVFLLILFFLCDLLTPDTLGTSLLLPCGVSFCVPQGRWCTTEFSTSFLCLETLAQVRMNSSSLPYL